MAKNLLLNVCCAPCALPLIEAAQQPALFFYGPNIYPREEYDKRLQETGKVAKLYDLTFLVGKYEHEDWLRYVTSQLPNLPETYQEGGERCQACFRFRLAGTAKFAKGNGFNRFATTLSVSRFKDVSFINCYGEELAQQLGLGICRV
jgi:predicted adenine nucleotide alpha hydrolase (AANH) superfamily ATPase